MEPSEMDNIIKSKLQEAHNVHQAEMESAKPFVWSAVQKNLGKRRTLNWYPLAAAILLLLISFTFIFNNVQKNHESEMVLLSNKIDQLQENYQSQLELSITKDKEVESLASELKNVKLQLSDWKQENPVSQKTNIVYQTDTVYLKQVEYITTISDPIVPNVKNIDSGEGQIEQLAKAENMENEIDYAIYPSFASQGKKQKSETIKVKFLKASRN